MSDTVVVPNNDPTAIESGNSWNGLDTKGAPVVVTFSFPTTLAAYDTSIGGFTAATDASYTAFTAAEQTQALAALGQWAAASGIVFLEVAPGQGDITFGNVSFSTTTTGSENGNYQTDGGIGFYPFGDWSYLTGNASTGYGFTSDLSTGGDVFMNSDYLNNGMVAFDTLLHEIGHAIGMKHPDQVVYTADGVEHNQVLDPNENSADYTIMSETGDSANAGNNATLFPLDQDAAADLYGPAGTGGVETGSASGSNSVSNWSWNAATETLTQTAVSANETIHGTSVDDVIYGYDYGGKTPTSGTIALFGLDGTNILYAGSGTTALYGGPGTNTLVGGAGNDSFYVYSNRTTVTDAYTTGDNTLYASGVNATLAKNVDTLYLYGSGLTGTGNAQNDSIFGDGVYSNILIAGSGNDYMVGGSGGNTLIAGTGVDTMYGGSGANIFVFGPGDAPINNPNGLDYIGDFKPGTDKLDLSLFARAGHPLTFVGTAPLTAPGQVDYFTSGGYTYVEGDVTKGGGADFEIQLSGTLNLQATDFVLSVPSAAWTGPSTKNRSGDWNTASDWTTGAVPDAVAQATISATGTYTITSNESNTIGNLLLYNKLATLDVDAGTFTIAGRGTDTNAGIIAVADAAALQVTGVFTNNGTIALNGAGDPTSLIIAGSATLKGTGQVTLGDSAQNGIVSDGVTATLTNLSTIVGSGTIRDANLTLTNGATGVIDATGTEAALTIASAGTFKNQHLLEATGSAGLIVDATLNNTGTVTVANGSALQVTGSVANNGTIAMNGTGDATSLVIARSATLWGTGQVTMTDAAGNRIVSNGAAATLSNQTTIEGSGKIGDANLTLTNAAAGVIDATGTIAALTIASAGTFKNQGTVEASGSAGLIVDSVLNNTASIIVADGSRLQVTGAVTNTGTIALNGTGDPTSLVIAGSVTLKGTGQVTLSDSAVNAIVSNGVAATLTNLSTIEGSGKVGDPHLTLGNGLTGIIDATGTAEALTIAGAGTFKNQGMVEATGSAGLTVNGAVLNTGTLAASAGNLTVTGNVTGKGSESIGNNGTLTFDATVAATQAVTFATGSTGTLALGDAPGFNGTVAGFTPGESIDLLDVAYTGSHAGDSFNTTTDMLKVTDGTNTAWFNVIGSYAAAFYAGSPPANFTGFDLNADGHGGTIVTYVHNAGSA